MDIYEEISQNIIEGEAEEVVRLINKGIATKYPVENILNQGLMRGIDILANKFKTQNVLIPEALLATRAFNAGLEHLEEHTKTKEKYKGRVIIGTVEGDFHDIGKNLVKTAISTLNIEIIDLGVDVSKEEFVTAIKEYKPDMLMISALLTTTIKEMKYIIKEIEKENLRDNIIIFVGGFPVTAQYAREIGADYYTKDVIEMKNFLSKNIDKLLKIK
ncbi:cobalamin B12-binding domain-containing protein [Clostridium sp.]|uniref:cobalamin B12-binding domain-containing protein n=1 Tax=Clostridium sp. TaxID=1506 RepID=UPI003F2BC339